MSNDEEFGREYASSQLARRHSTVRRLIKSHYISNLLRHVTGPTVDVGCGAGQILERLPAGSVGIEVNPHLVHDLTNRGLKVFKAIPRTDRLDLSAIARGAYTTLVLSHVLEHFGNASQVLRLLLEDCADRKITTVIVVVPGEVGYRSDQTHKTFITLNYVREHHLTEYCGFSLAQQSYFPGNMRFLGKLFVYHELMLVYQTNCRTR